MGLYRLRRSGLLIVSLLLMIAVDASAQLEYTNWIFGRGAGIGFNDGNGKLVAPVPAFTGNMMRTDWATSTWSDPCTGELELYSDGVHVWNARHEIIDGGDGTGRIGTIFGNVLFVPYPGQSDTVFLVSTRRLLSSESVDIGYRYVLWTIARAGYGKPWHVASERPFGDTSYGALYNKVVATHDAWRAGYWIVTTHMQVGPGETGIAAFHVGAEGFDDRPVLSPVQLLSWNGQFTCSRDGRRLVNAGSLMDGGHFEHWVDIIDLDKATGKCVYRGRLDLEPVVGHRDQGSVAKYRHAYGACFSPSGRYCYVNTRINQRFDNDPADPTVGVLVQFDLEAGSWQDVQKSGVEIATTPLWAVDDDGSTEWGEHGRDAGGMQLGPDGVIYVAGGDTALSAILRPDAGGQGCTFVRDGLRLGRGNVSPAMPKCIESSFLKQPPGQCFPANVILETTSVCEGESLMIGVGIDGWSEDTSWTVTGPDNAQRTQQGGETFVWPSASAGTYTVGITVRGYFGNVTRTTTVEVHSRPAVDAGDTMTVCSGGAVQLRATGAASYRWTPTDGLDDTTSASPIVTNVMNDRRYVVTGKSEFGCEGVDTVWIRIAPLKGTMTAPGRMCLGEEVDIVVTGGVSIRWIQGHASTDPQEYSIRVRPTERTTFRAIVDDGACSDTVETTIDVLPLPILRVSDDTTVCRGAPARLHATGAVAYRWEPATGLDDPTSADPMATPETTTTYHVTAIDANGCMAVDSVSITIDELVVEAMMDTIVCEGSIVRLAASSDGRHRWFALPERIPLEGSTPEVTVTATTDYMVVADQGACIGYDTIRVTAEPFPTLSIPDDTTICAGDIVMLEAHGSEGVEWSTDGGDISDDEGRITVSPEITTRYVATSTSRIGCRTVDTVTVTVGNARTIVVTAPTLVAKPDDRVAIPIRIRSAGYRGPLELETVVTPPIVRLDATDAGRHTVTITDDDQTLVLHGLAVLGTSTHAVIDPVVHDDGLSRCSASEIHAGEVVLEGCAIDRRYISIFGSMKVWAMSVATGLSVEVEGGIGTYDVTWYDPYGRATYHAGGLAAGRALILPPGEVTPLGFLDVRSGAERVVMPIMVRGD